jgi:hypothetical protein
VIDLDVGAWGRFGDSVEADEVPFFDRLDEVEDRTQVDVQVRSRLETRRVVTEGKAQRRNATLADVLLRVSLWPEEKGPYLQRGTGEAELRWMAELLPERMWWRGEGVSSLDRPGVLHASTGVAWTPSLDLHVSGGIRYVRDETFGPITEVYWRYAPKWGFRSSLFVDFERSADPRFKLSLYRYSEDHFFEVGATIRDGGDDVSFVFNFLPAIGGIPISEPFDPRSDLDFTP